MNFPIKQWFTRIGNRLIYACNRQATRGSKNRTMHRTSTSSYIIIDLQRDDQGARAVQVTSHFKSHSFTYNKAVGYRQPPPLDHPAAIPSHTQTSFPELDDSSNILVTSSPQTVCTTYSSSLHPLSNAQRIDTYSHQQLMFGEDDSESPRVASPWDPFLASPSSRSVSSLELSSSLASCTPGSAPTFPRSIPKLVPEAEQVPNPTHRSAGA